MQLSPEVLTVIGTSVMTLLLVLGYFARRVLHDYDEGRAEARVELRDLRERLTRAESQIQAMPTNREVADLRAELSDLRQGIAHVQGQFESFKAMLQAVHAHVVGGP